MARRAQQARSGWGFWRALLRAAALVWGLLAIPAAKAQGCAKPNLFCSHVGSTYTGDVDCDGDGLNDHICFDVLGRRWAILSTTAPACPDGLGVAPVSACPTVFSRQVIQPGCPFVSGYLAVPDRDFTNYMLDINNQGWAVFPNETPLQLGDRCTADPSCLGFNSRGEIKFLYDPNRTFGTVAASGLCSYVKLKGPDVCPNVPKDYAVAPGMNTDGSLLTSWSDTTTMASDCNQNCDCKAFSTQYQKLVSDLTAANYGFVPAGCEGLMVKTSGCGGYYWNNYGDPMANALVDGTGPYCMRPVNGFCDFNKDVYLYVTDCDGDGIRDLVCKTPSNPTEAKVVLSSKGCTVTAAAPADCPAILNMPTPSGRDCPFHINFCEGYKVSYISTDCDGDGFRDWACSGNGRLFTARSSDGCRRVNLDALDPASRNLCPDAFGVNTITGSSDQFRLTVTRMSPLGEVAVNEEVVFMTYGTHCCQDTPTWYSIDDGSTATPAALPRQGYYFPGPGSGTYRELRFKFNSTGVQTVTFRFYSTQFADTPVYTVSTSVKVATASISLALSSTTAWAGLPSLAITSASVWNLTPGRTYYYSVDPGLGSAAAAVLVGKRFPFVAAPTLANGTSVTSILSQLQSALAPDQLMYAYAGPRTVTLQVFLDAAGARPAIASAAMDVQVRGAVLVPSVTRATVGTPALVFTTVGVVNVTTAAATLYYTLDLDQGSTSSVLNPAPFTVPAGGSGTIPAVSGLSAQALKYLTAGSKTLTLSIYINSSSSSLLSRSTAKIEVEDTGYTVRLTASPRNPAPNDSMQLTAMVAHPTSTATVYCAMEEDGVLWQSRIAVTPSASGTASSLITNRQYNVTGRHTLTLRVYDSAVGGRLLKTTRIIVNVEDKSYRLQLTLGRGMDCNDVPLANCYGSDKVYVGQLVFLQTRIDNDLFPRNIYAALDDGDNGELPTGTPASLRTVAYWNSYVDFPGITYLTPGQRTITFTIYDAPAGGNVLRSTQLSFTVLPIPVPSAISSQNWKLGTMALTGASSSSSNASSQGSTAPVSALPNTPVRLYLTAEGGYYSALYVFLNGQVGPRNGYFDRWMYNLWRQTYSPPGTYVPDATYSQPGRYTAVAVVAPNGASWDPNMGGASFFPVATTIQVEDPSFTLTVMASTQPLITNTPISLSAALYHDTYSGPIYFSVDAGQQGIYTVAGSNATAAVGSSSNSEFPAGTLESPRSALVMARGSLRVPISAPTYTSPGTKVFTVRVYDSPVGGILLRTTSITLQVEDTGYQLSLVKAAPLNPTTADLVSFTATLTAPSGASMVYYTFGDSSIWTNNSMSSNGEAAMRVAKALAPGASTNIVLLPVLYYSAGSKTAVMRVYDAPSGGTLLRSATAAFQVFSVAESAAYTLSMSMAASSGLPGSIVPGVPTVVQATVVHPTSNATVYWSLINGESTTEMPAGTTAAPRTAVRPSASGTTFTLPAFTYTSSGTKRAIVKLYSAATGGSLLRYFVLQVMVESSDYTVSLTKISPSADATTLDYVSISADVTINIQQNSGPLYWSVDAGDGVLPPGGMLMASGAYGSVVDVPSYISYPGGPGSGRMWWNPFAASSNTNGSVNASSIVPNGGLQQSTLSVGVFKYITGGMKTISFWLWDASMGGNLLRSSTLLVSVTKLSVSASLAIEPTTTVTGTAYQRISTATVTGIDTNTYNYYFSFDMGPGGMYSARRRQSADLTPLGSNVYQINFLTSLAPEQLMYYSLGVKTARLQVFSSLKTVTDSDSVPMILEVEATANITVTTGVDITLSSNTAFLDQPSFTITSARVTGLSDGMDFRCKLSLLDEDGNAISAADYPATQMINDSPGMTQPFTVPTMSGTVDLLPILGPFATDAFQLRPRILQSTDPYNNYGFGQRYLDLAIYRPGVNAGPNMPDIDGQEYVARGRAPLLIEDPAWSLNVSKLQPFGNPTLRMPIILKLSYGHRPSATPTPSVYGMVSILLTTEEHENTVGMGFSASVDTYSSVNQEFQYNLPFYWFRTPGVKTIKAMLATGNGDSRFKRNIIRSTTFSLTILSPSLSAPAYYITRVRPTPVNPVFGQPATMAVTITRSWSPLNTTTAFVCKLFNGEGAEPQSYAAYQALSGADKSARAVMAAGGSSATCTFTGVVYNTVTQPGSRFHKILVFNEQTNEAVMSEPYGFDVSVSSVAATYSLVQSLTSMSPPNPVVGDPVNWTATISRSVQVTGSMPLEIECKLFTGEWTEPLSPDMYRRLPAPYTAVAPMYPNALTATCVWSGITYATAAAGRTAKIVVFENGVPLFATAQQVAQPFTVMPARAATSLTVLPDQDEYVGCFRDAAVYEERRLPFYLYERFGGADLESCAQAARQAGVPYYGLQDGDICLGGNDLAAATSLGPADCSAPCRAETASVCGGAFANSIYRVVRSSPDVIGNGTMLPDVPALCEPGYLVHNAHYFFTGGLITSSDARLRAQARLADDGSFQPPRQLTPTAWQLTGGPAGGAASWLGSYSPRTACGWVFRTPPGSVTTLRIRYLNTESYFDRLEIWPLLPAASSTSTVTADVPPNMTYSYAAVTSPAAAVAGSQNYLQVGSQTVAFISDTTSASASVALAVGTVFPVYSRTSPADTSTQLPASCYCAPGSSTLPYNATGPQIVYSRVFSSTSILVVFSQPVTVNLATCASAFVLQGAFDGMPLAATIPFSSCGLAAFTTGAQAAELPAAATSGTALVLRLASGFDTSMIPAGATSSIGVNLIAGQIAVRQGSVVLPAGGSPLQPMPLSLKALITAPPFDTVTDACVTQCRPPSFDAAPMVRAVAGVPGADANPVEALRARGAAALAAVSSATPLAAFSGALSQSEFAEPLLTLHNDFMVYFRSDAANNLDGFIIEYNVTTAAAAAAYMPSYQTAVGTGGPSGTFDPAAYTSDLNTYYSYRNRVGGDVYDRVFASNATAGCARTLYYQPPAAADGMWLLNCGAAGQQ